MPEYSVWYAVNSCSPRHVERRAVDLGPGKEEEAKGDRLQKHVPETALTL